VSGTVLNRFVIQPVIGHPLTVYGEGGQARLSADPNLTRAIRPGGECHLEPE